MKVTRAKKRYNPTTGEKRYYKVELQCMCGNTRKVSEDELLDALEKCSQFLKFKCSQCLEPRLGLLIHRQWFEWHTFKYDLFPTW